MTTDVTIPWRPPAGFAGVASKLAGVTVYAPAPAADLGPEALTFKCPRCGASTAYDPAAASVTCASCGNVQPLEAKIVGRAAASAEFTLDVLDREARGWGEERRELHCDSCGANLSVAPNDLSTTCPFCASNRVVARTATNEALRPRFIIPFKVEPGACQRLAGAWLGRGWMFPAGLAASAGSAQVRGTYLPFWTFSAQVHSDWDAEVGYEHTRQVYDHASKEWRTETEIEWRWERGQVTLPCTDWLGIGTSKVNPALLQRLYPFDLNALSDYQPGFLAGWQALAYDVKLPEAWDRARGEMRERARHTCRRAIASPHVRNMHIAAAFEDESWRYILLPVYLAAYRFGGQAYLMMINGQTGAVAGQKPVAWAKVWLAVAASLVPGVALCLLGLPLTLLGGLGVILIVVGALLFVVGLVVSGIILTQAMKAGEA